MSGPQHSENGGWRNAGNYEGYRDHDYRTATRNNSTGNYQNGTGNGYNRAPDGNWRSNPHNVIDQQWRDYDSGRPRRTQSALNLNTRTATPPERDKTLHNDDDIVKSYNCIPTNDVIDEIRAVHLEQFETKDMFICRLKDDIKLEEMLEEMQKDCNAENSYTGMLEPGEICCAKFAPHGKWYRVRVENVVHGEYDIFDVDFGITGKTMCSSVRGMKRKFCQLPARAFQCSLEGTKSDWTDETDEWLLNFIKDRELFCWFKGPPKDSLYPVSLLLKDDLNRAALLATDVEYLKENMQLLMEKREADENDMLSGDLDEEQQSELDDGTAPCSTYPQYTYIASLALSTMEVARVVISWVESEYDFYCNLKMCKDDLDELNDKLQNVYNGEQEGLALQQLTPDTPCVAKFPDDELWYRAEIKKMNGKEVEVIFVDYGNVETIAVDDLRQITKEFVKLPAQALHCVIPTPNHGKNLTYEDVGSERAYYLLSYRNQCYTVEESNDNEDQVFIDDQNGKVESRFLAEDGSVDSEAKLEETGSAMLLYKVPTLQEECSEVLVKDIMATDEMEELCTAVDKTCTVHEIPHCRTRVYMLDPITSPVDFWVQIEDNTWNLSEKVGTVEDIARMPVEYVTEGMICASTYNDDGVWYRAEVITKHSDSMSTVLFIDYGNRETKPNTELFTLDNDTACFPPLAYHCQLSSIVSESNWTPEAVAKFEELTGHYGKALLAEFADSDTSPIPVRLLDCGIDVAKTLSSLGFCTYLEPDGEECAEECVPRYTQAIEELAFDGTDVEDENDLVLCDVVSEHQDEYPENMLMHRVDEPIADVGLQSDEDVACFHTKVYIIEPVTSPVDFWVQIEDPTFNLYEKVGTVEDIPKIRLEDVTEGVICASTYNDDGAWYRAKILTKHSDSTSTVLFIDYGNHETKRNTDLFALDTDVACFPPLAVHCQLSGIVSETTWTSDAIAKFEELTGHYGKALLAEFWDSGTSPVPVRLLDCGIDVAKTLASLGYCTYLEPDDEECAVENVRGNMQDDSFLVSSPAGRVYEAEYKGSSFCEDMKSSASGSEEGFVGDAEDESTIGSGEDKSTASESKNQVSEDKDKEVSIRDADALTDVDIHVTEPGYVSYDARYEMVSICQGIMSPADNSVEGDEDVKNGELSTSEEEFFSSCDTWLDELTSVYQNNC